MKESYNCKYVKLYDTKMIVKFEKINDTIIDTYIECVDGELFLKTYVNGKIHSSSKLPVSINEDNDNHIDIDSVLKRK